MKTYKLLLLVFVLSFVAPTSSIRAQPSVPSSFVVDTNALRFIAMGDWGRNGQYNQQAVADEMGKLNEVFDAKFILALGDNFYCCGVASIDDPQWMSSFENIYRNHSLQIDWYPVLGNHDYKGNPQAEVDYTKKSRRWVLPSRYHTYVKKADDGTPVRFVIIDTNPFIEGYQKKVKDYGDLATQDAKKQLQWIDSVLANSKEPWKIVAGHHPVYSSGGEHGDQKELIELLKPRFEKYHVDAYFAGHEHDMQHQSPAGSSVQYFVSGAGSEVRPTGKKEMTKFSASTPGFMNVSITKNQMLVQAIDTIGNILYSTTIQKQ